MIFCGAIVVTDRCSMDLPKAEIVLLNGRVFRGLAEGTAGAVAIWGGRVLATGSDAEIEPLIGRTTRVIDLRGRLARPGLFDAHLHLLPYGLAMAELDVRPRQAPTLAALLAEDLGQRRRGQAGSWVLARGYDQIPPRREAPPDPSGARRGRAGESGPSRAELRPHLDLQFRRAPDRPGRRVRPLRPPAASSRSATGGSPACSPRTAAIRSGRCCRPSRMPISSPRSSARGSIASRSASRACMDAAVGSKPDFGRSPRT